MVKAKLLIHRKGNHELYLASVATLTMQAFASYWGEKYLTSNVNILNTKTGTYQPLGRQYRYFTTPHGLRIMAFGVLYDFTGNTNITQARVPWTTLDHQKYLIFQ